MATRRFAVDKLHGLQSAEIAKAITIQTQHPDRNLREAALTTLLSFAGGRAAILDELLSTEDVERAWFLAKALAPSAQQPSAAQRTKSFMQAAKYHDADDRRAAPLLFFLRTMDHAWTRDQLEAKALEQRKKKEISTSNQLLPTARARPGLQ